MSVPIGSITADNAELVFVAARAENDRVLFNVLDESLKKSAELRKEREAAEAERREREARENRSAEIERREREAAQEVADRNRALREETAVESAARYEALRLRTLRPDSLDVAA